MKFPDFFTKRNFFADFGNCNSIFFPWLYIKIIYIFVLHLQLLRLITRLAKSKAVFTK